MLVSGGLTSISFIHDPWGPKCNDSEFITGSQDSLFWGMSKEILSYDTSVKLA